MMKSFKKYITESFKFGYNDIFLAEELTDEQKAKVDSWGPNTKARIISGHVIPLDSDRVTIPLEHPEDQKPAIPHPAVQKHLDSHGFGIADYKSGLANDPKYPNRKVRIGALLKKTNAPKDVIDAFENDPNRATSKSGGLQVVISRHPHDVAGMSTDRGWTSCMNMVDGESKHYLKHDVQQGTHVAYLTAEGDHEAKRPLARIALKPFEDVADHEKDGSKTILRPEEEQYGTSDNAFGHTVNKWAEKNFPGNSAYQKNENVYDDSFSENDTILGKHADVEHLLNTSNSPEVKGAIAAHPHLTPSQVDRLVNDDSKDTRWNIARNPNLQPHHIDKMINDPFPTARRGIAERKDLTPEHIDRLINDPVPTVRRVIAERKDLTPEHIDKLINDKEHFVYGAIARRKDLQPRHIDALLNRPEVLKSENMRNDLSSNPNLEDHHIDKLIDDPNWSTRYSLASQKNLQPRHIEKLIKDSDLSVARVASRHPNALPHQRAYVK